MFQNVFNNESSTQVTSGICPLPPTGTKGTQEVPQTQQSSPLLGAETALHAKLHHTEPYSWQGPAAPTGQSRPGTQPDDPASWAPAGICHTSQQHSQLSLVFPEKQILVLFAHRRPRHNLLGCATVFSKHRCPRAPGIGVQTWLPPLH